MTSEVRWTLAATCFVAMAASCCDEQQVWALGFGLGGCVLTWLQLCGRYVEQTGKWRSMPPPASAEAETIDAGEVSQTRRVRRPSKDDNERKAS